MQVDVKVYSLLFSISSIIFLVLTHIIFFRIFNFFNQITSRQKFLINLIISLNFILFFILLYLNLILYSDLDLFYSSLYILLVFNLGAYIYFHIFNLSETGRRIKLLSTIKNNVKLNLIKLNKLYSVENMIQNRINRLLSMNEIRLTRGKIYLNKSRLIVIAKFIKKLGIICTGKNRHRSQ